MNRLPLPTHSHALRMSAALLLGCAASALAVQPAFAQQAPASSAHTFAIEAQPLVDAMREFSRETGIQVAYTAAIGSGVQSPGVSGSYSPAEALSRLLTGTGLTYRFTGANAVTLEPAPNAGAETVQLGPVRVAADDQQGATIPTPKTDRAATDRSRSYAARAATVAGKTPQTLREIPQSISVVTRQRLDDQNIVTLEEALRQTPGVTAMTYNQTAGYFAIRGFQPEIQYDGIPSLGDASYAVAYDLAIYDRIEVLRGPSGLMQGNGEPAGTVNLVRKRPHDTFGWAGSLMAGRWNNFHGDLDITGPLNAAGTIRGRVVAAGGDRDYFYDFVHQKHWTLYGIVEADITPNTTFTLSGTIQDRDVKGFDYGQSAYVNQTFLNAPRSSYFGLDWANAKPKNREAYASLDHDLGGGWTTKASVAYRYETFPTLYGFIGNFVNLDNSADSYSVRSQYNRDSNVTSDAYIAGPVSLFGRTHTVTIGANYGWRSYINRLNFVNVSVADIYNIDIPNISSTIPLRQRNDIHMEQYGAYGQLKLNVADPLKILLGGRVSSFHSKIRRGQPFGAFQKDNLGKADWHFTPSAALLFEPTKNVTLYGSYVSIFVPQANRTVGGDFIKPRTGEQFEIGAKAALLDGALNASLALYSLTDRNRALADSANPGFAIAAGKIRSRGVEAELSGEPLPGWSVSAAYTYLQTKFLSDPTNQGKIFSLEEPKHTVKLWSLYRFGEIDEPGFQVGAGVRYQTATTRFSAGGPVQEAYAIADAQVGYRLNEQWSATLSVTNLFDKHYYIRVPGQFFGFYGEPRNVTVTLRKAF